VGSRNPKINAVWEPLLCADYANHSMRNRIYDDLLSYRCSVTQPPGRELVSYNDRSHSARLFVLSIEYPTN